MSFLKRIFGKRGDEVESAPRSLNHPRDLFVGDIVKFGFAAQEGISNQSFGVESVDTYDLGGEQYKKTVFILDGTAIRYRLAVITDSIGERLEVARRVLPEDVQQVFDTEAFIDLLDPDTGVNHVLERKGEPDHLAGWTAPVYRQEAGHNAYFYSGDYRHRLLPSDAESGDPFSYYLLVSEDRQFALEVQVYDGGRTDVYLLAYLQLAKVEEFWPAAL